MARKARVSAAVLSLMRQGRRHAWTLEELHAGLSRRGDTIDFSSVFRASEKLAAAAVVRKLVLADGRARFELVGEHHDHLYCTRCHGILPIPCIFGHDDFQMLERKTGAAILDHHLILSGICRTCRRGLAKRGARTGPSAKSPTRAR
ncbi:MAG TPA: transcriptional repressor [Stellaceae bacterium]|nr:transcriptional repressor [Stellaceae bacterium]